MCRPFILEHCSVMPELNEQYQIPTSVWYTPVASTVHDAKLETKAEVYQRRCYAEKIDLRSSGSSLIV